MLSFRIMNATQLLTTNMYILYTRARRKNTKFSHKYVHRNVARQKSYQSFSNISSSTWKKNVLIFQPLSNVQFGFVLPKSRKSMAFHFVIHIIYGMHCIVMFAKNGCKMIKKGARTNSKIIKRLNQKTWMQFQTEQRFIERTCYYTSNKSQYKWYKW